MSSPGRRCARDRPASPRLRSRQRPMGRRPAARRPLARPWPRRAGRRPAAARAGARGARRRPHAEATYELGRAPSGVRARPRPRSCSSPSPRAPDDPELHLRAIEDAAWTYFDSGNRQGGGPLARVEPPTLTPPERSEERAGAEALALLPARRWTRAATRGGRAHPRDRRGGRPPYDPGRAPGSPGGSRSTLSRRAIPWARSSSSRPPFRRRPGPEEGAVPGIADKVLIRCGETDLAREATARGLGECPVERPGPRCELPGELLAEIDRHAGTPCRLRGGGSHRLGHGPRLLPRLASGPRRDLQPAGHSLARGELDEAGELAAQWDLSAPFSVVPLTPILLEIRGLAPARHGRRSTPAPRTF